MSRDKKSIQPINLGKTRLQQMSENLANGVPHIKELKPWEGVDHWLTTADLKGFTDDEVVACVLHWSSMLLILTKHLRENMHIMTGEMLLQGKEPIDAVDGYLKDSSEKLQFTSHVYQMLYDAAKEYKARGL